MPEMALPHGEEKGCGAKKSKLGPNLQCLFIYGEGGGGVGHASWAGRMGGTETLPGKEFPFGNCPFIPAGGGGVAFRE